MEKLQYSSPSTDNDYSTVTDSCDTDAANSVESKLSGSLRSIGLVLSSDDENRMIIPLLLNFVSTRALVDSGAALSMVHHGWLVDSGLQFRPCLERSIHGFGCGSRVKIVGTVVLK